VLELFIPGFVEKSCKDEEYEGSFESVMRTFEEKKSYAEQNKQTVFYYGHSFVVQPFVFSRL
jgi:hypothetical protein